MTLIVDLSGSRSARFCARLAAVAGDEVIRFESVEARDRADGVLAADIRDAYLSMSIVKSPVDWSNPDDRASVETTISRAGVAISSFSNGCFDSPYDENAIRQLNPEIVHLIVSPFGTDGPYAHLQSNSLIDWAAGGYLYITGEPGQAPLPGPDHMCAYAAGYIAAIAMEAGLASRNPDGVGVSLDLSQMEAMLSLHQGAFPRWTSGELMVRSGNDVGPATYPSGSYPCLPGRLFLAIVTDEEWDRFVIAVGRPELSHDPRLETGHARKLNRDLTDQVVTSWCSQRDAVEAAATLQANRVPASECPTPEGLLNDAQLRYRGYVREVKLPQTEIAARFPGEVLPMQTLRGAAAGREAKASDVATKEPAGLPLDGVTVLDLSIWWAGPMAARILGDLGANVIRIERPTRPGGGRRWPDWHRFVHEQMNRNKRSLAIDIRAPAGLAIIERLIRRSDVLVQNFRPGAMERLGLGWKSALEVNPQLIYIALSGYGSEGPKSRWGSYGTLSEAASSVWGLTHYSDGGGMRLGDQLPDAICGLAGALAALRGLRQRRRTNSGCHFDISQLEAYVALIGEEIGAASIRSSGALVENPEGGPPLQGLFRCAGPDSWVAVTVPDRPAADDLMVALHLKGSADTVIGLRAALEQFSSTRSRQSVAEFLQAVGIRAFPVATAEDLVADTNLRERSFFTTATLDGVTGSLPGSPIRSPGRSLTAFRRRAPTEGEHSLEILRDELMLSEAEIGELVASRVVVQRDH